MIVGRIPFHRCADIGFLIPAGQISFKQDPVPVGDPPVSIDIKAFAGKDLHIPTGKILYTHHGIPVGYFIVGICIADHTHTSCVKAGRAARSVFGMPRIQAIGAIPFGISGDLKRLTGRTGICRIRFG